MSDLRFIVREVFRLTGRSPVIVGYVEAGSVEVGDELVHLRDNREIERLIIIGFEMPNRKPYREPPDVALCAAIDPTHFQAGDVLRSASA
jgi:translation elongation factor EF-Tu-like GTPase